MSVYMTCAWPNTRPFGVRVAMEGGECHARDSQNWLIRALLSLRSTRVKGSALVTGFVLASWRDSS